jgi:hypothetical protein
MADLAFGMAMQDFGCDGLILGDSAWNGGEVLVVDVGGMLGNEPKGAPLGVVELGRAFSGIAVGPWGSLTGNGALPRLDRLRELAGGDDQPRYVFRKARNGRTWETVFYGIRADPITHVEGMDAISILFEHPRQTFNLRKLDKLNGSLCPGTPNAGEVHFEEGLREHTSWARFDDDVAFDDLKIMLDGLLDKRKKAEALGRPSEALGLTEKIKYVREAMDNAKPRDEEFKRLYNRCYVRIVRAREHIIKSVGEQADLARHLRHCLEYVRRSWGWRYLPPDEIRWVVER